jgi:putative membrane protein
MGPILFAQYYDMMDNGDAGWGIFMMFFWLLFLGIIAYFGLRLLRSHEQGNTSQTRDPLDIAKERYAKGEIDKEQFEQLKKDLSK